MSYGWHDLVGMVGVVLILVAYLLLQTQRMSADSPRYSILNGIGACLILISLTVDFNLSAAVIEGFWLAISLYGLLRWTRSRQG